MEEFNGNNTGFPNPRHMSYGFLSLCLIVVALVVAMKWAESDKTEPEVEVSKTTLLEVQNCDIHDSVLVYLTLSAGKGFVSDVNGVFGIKSTNKLQGTFYLNPRETIKYNCPKGKAISGNISFWTPPKNCPYIGTTLFEFTLNNKGTVVNAQETVDISCVAGVNSKGRMVMTNGGNWTDNVHANPIVLIENDSLYKNTGKSGVFPYGCTNCINTKGAPNCKDRPSYATPNKKNICNVQRNAINNGGSIRICYLKKY